MNRDNKSNEEKDITPVLVKNPKRTANPKSHINIAPLFEGISYLDTFEENPMVTLGEFAGNIAKIIATSYMEDGMVIDGLGKEEIVYGLFHLEKYCKKCTLVNL